MTLDAGASGIVLANQITGSNIAKAALKKSPNWSKAERDVRKMLDAIRVAHREGKRKRADYQTQTYLQSYHARYVAAVRAWRSLKKHQRPSFDLLPVIAQKLNAWEGTIEDVVLRWKEKSDQPGNFRPIMAFGIENRGLQYLVCSVLEVRADLHSSQYLLKGVHQAINRVAELMADGYLWAIETDIRDCYRSFDGEKAPDYLPIPERVTRSSLLSASLHLKLHPYWTNLFGPSCPAGSVMFAEDLADARRGFPQGSAASSLAVEMLLAPLFGQLPKSGASIGYADNFLAVARNKADVVSMTEAFWSALKAHPAGQLGPKKPKVFEPGQPIEFLGHRLRSYHEVVRIDPTPQNRAGFRARLASGLSGIRAASSHPILAAQRMRKLRDYVFSWTAASRLCTDMESCRAHAVGLIALAKQAYATGAVNV